MENGNGNGVNAQNEEGKQFNGQSLASDGPISKAEGTESADLNDNDTSKSFDRDQEELDLGLDDGDLDTEDPELSGERD